MSEARERASENTSRNEGREEGGSELTESETEGRVNESRGVSGESLLVREVSSHLCGGTERERGKQARQHFRRNEGDTDEARSRGTHLRGKP